MEDKLYYVYEHWSNFSGSVFYVGVSKKDNRYSRSKIFKGRSNRWESEFILSKKEISVKIVSDNLTLSEASEKEKDLILKYGRKNIDDNGILCNIDEGGIHNKVIQYSRDGDFMKIWDNIKQVSKYFEIKSTTLNASIYLKSLTNGFQWRFYSKNYLDKIEKYNAYKYIHQFDKNGEYIKTWASIREACNYYNMDDSSIRHAISGRNPTSGGFRWSYDKNQNFEDLNPIIIIQYDLFGNKINEFNRISEIVKYLNLTSCTAIRNCFTGKQKQAYGFKWEKITKSKELGLSEDRLSNE